MSAENAHAAIGEAKKNLDSVGSFLHRGGSLTIGDRIAVALVYATLALAESNLERE